MGGGSTHGAAAFFTASSCKGAAGACCGAVGSPCAQVAPPASAASAAWKHLAVSVRKGVPRSTFSHEAYHFARAAEAFGNAIAASTHSPLQTGPPPPLVTRV